MELKWDKPNNETIENTKKVDFYREICLNTLSLQEIYNELVQQDPYHTNSIEGSTVTYSDTIKIIKDKFYNESKYQLSEIATVTGYKSALDYCFERLHEKEDITEEFICDIHFNLMRNVKNVDSGVYRYENTGTFFKGAAINYSDFTTVPDEMEELVSRYNRYKHNNIEHILEAICNLKCDFIVTHPFVDGNGRVSRLLLNYALLTSGYLPVVIMIQEKEEYIQTLEHFRVTGNSDKFINFISSKLIKTYKNLQETGELKFL